MNKQSIAVVGKVQQGRMTTVVASGNRMVGSIRPITQQVKPTVTLVPHTPHKVYTYEPIDSPFISMVQANHIRMKEEKQARMEAIAIQNKRNNRINTIKNLFKGMK